MPGKGLVCDLKSECERPDLWMALSLCWQNESGERMKAELDEDLMNHVGIS